MLINSYLYPNLNINFPTFPYNRVYQMNTYQPIDNLNLSNAVNFTNFPNFPISNLFNNTYFPNQQLSPMSLGFSDPFSNNNLNNIATSNLLISLIILLLSLITSYQSNHNNFLGPSTSNNLGIGPNPNGLGIGPNPNGLGIGSDPNSLGVGPNPNIGSPFNIPSIPFNTYNTINPQNLINTIGTGNGSVVGLALQQVGKPYIFGAAGPNAFDCSGLVYWVFKQRGINFPRTADQQFKVGTPVPPNQLQPGDLVFFANTYCPGISHVGIYIGNGKFVHAANSRKGVIVSSLSESYYRQHYAGAKRV